MLHRLTLFAGLIAGAAGCVGAYPSSYGSSPYSTYSEPDYYGSRRGYQDNDSYREPRRDGQGSSKVEREVRDFGKSAVKKLKKFF